MHNRGWTPLIPVFALMLTLLVGLYVGAYYTLVTPVRVYLADKTERRGSGCAYFMNASPQLSPRYQPVLGIRPARFFEPIHWLDRRMRPETWQQKSPLASGPSIEAVAMP